MGRFLVVVIILAVIIGAVGFSRGWFSMTSTNPAVGRDKTDIHFTVDRDKIREDANRLEQKTDAVIGNTKKTVDSAVSP